MKNKNKHDHRLTNFLKVFIFMIIMLAPFIAIGVKCWYVAKNPNAVQSYRGQYEFEDYIKIKNLLSYDNHENTTDNQKIDISTINTTFYYTYTNTTDAQSSMAVSVDPLIFNELNNLNIPSSTKTIVIKNQVVQHQFELYTSTNELDDNFSFNYNTSTSNLVLYKQYAVGDTLRFVSNQDYIYFSTTYTNRNTVLYNSISEFTLVIDNTLSSVFYSAVQELDDASIFSWTTKTAIYSGLLAMSEGLGVDTPPLAVLLTYWTIITSIYIIIDIILEMFIFLTHWLNDKIC